MELLVQVLYRSTRIHGASMTKAQVSSGPEGAVYCWPYIQAEALRKTGPHSQAGALLPYLSLCGAGQSTTLGNLFQKVRKVVIPKDLAQQVPLSR